MQRYYYVQHCKVNVGGACYFWEGLLTEWGVLQWAFSAEQSIGHSRFEQPLLQERGGGADLQFHATLLLRAALQS